MFDVKRLRANNLTFYIVNPTSLAKKHAVNLLEADIKSFDVDVALVCETWFADYHSDECVNIPGYALFRRDRKGRKGGGVCAYVRKTLDCSFCKLDLGISAEQEIENLWVKISFNNNDSEFYICCIYFPPKPVYSIADFRYLLTCQVENVFLNSIDPVVLCAGDYNRLNTDFIETDLGLKQIVKEPTHCGRLLDKVFTNRPDLFVASTTKSLIKTKHSALLVRPCNSMANVIPPSNQKRKKVTLYDTRQFNIDRLRYFIGNFNWSSVYWCNNIQRKYDIFITSLKDIIAKAVPCKIVTMGTRDPPFMTPLVKDLLNNRRKLLCKGRTQEADVLAIKINELIGNIRSQSFNKLNNASIKQLWSSIKPRTSDIAPIPACLQDVNAVNRYFSGISYDSSSSFNYDSVRMNETFRETRDVGLHTQYQPTLSPGLVEYFLSKLKSTSPGVDMIPSWVYQKCSFELSEVICHIFSESLLSGEIPDHWRQAVVTPIPKVPKPTHLNDLRPISVTPILSRVLEKYIVKNIIFPAIPSQLLSDQFAYRPSGSTSCALIYTLHHVTQMLENNAYVRCVTIDFSKAFDVIDHGILLNKVRKLNLPVNIHNWIVSFLQCRSQVLSYKGITSDACYINRGIIQGSGLGPVNFCIMANDLKTLSLSNILCKYADDMDVLTAENSDVGMEDEISNIRRWASENKMSINFNKTKEIVFRRPCPRQSLCLPNLTDIERVNNVKMLGVNITDNLKMDAHVKTILSACSQRLYLIKQIKNQGLCSEKLDIIFQALIISKMTYALPAWGGFLTVELSNSINAFFKRAFKYKLVSKIFKIEELLRDADCKLFGKVRNPSHCLFQLLPHTEADNKPYGLRARGHPYPLPTINTQRFKSSFVNRNLFNLK